MSTDEYVSNKVVTNYAVLLVICSLCSYTGALHDNIDAHLASVPAPSRADGANCSGTIRLPWGVFGICICGYTLYRLNNIVPGFGRF